MRDFDRPGRSAVFATNGMCATSHPLAASTAIDILKAGGNAVDAAISAAVLLGLCEPQMTGIGGDCFALIKPAGSDRILTLNGSGRAPKALDAAVLRGRGLISMPHNDVNAVTVPGAIDAFCKLAADWGRLGLADVLAPAIRYAEEGVPVAPRVARDWSQAAPELTGKAREMLLNDGKPLGVGQLFRAPGQAEVLRRISREGRKGFYEGEVAEDMVASLRALGGTHTLDDFAATECSYGEPISGPYRDVELLEHPPNGVGATAILILKILSHFDLARLDPFGSARAHLEAEATKLALDARNRFVADPAHVTRLDHMLSTETAAKLAALIHPAQAMKTVSAATEAVHKETITISVVDKDRMVVSLIYSIFDDFGSGILSNKFGIIFQNRGAGFSLQEGHPNEALGGKRPLHTIIPGMLRKAGKIIMPFGVMGGQYQPTGHARLITNMLDFGMGPQEAIDGARCFSGSEGMEVESGYSDKVRQELTALGHKVVAPSRPLGGAQAIFVHDDGVLEGASDPRKDGCALGY